MINQFLRLLGATALALGMAGSALAQSGPVLSPQAQAVLEGWRAMMTGQKALVASFPPSQTVAQELARRIAIEQAGRQSLSFIRSNLSSDDSIAVISAVGSDITALDADNTAYLKTVLPADGWFRNSRDGSQVGRDAWLIVQHSPDREFQKTVVVAMGKLLPLGEVRGPDYALLYDRNEMFEGRPQRYGSQGTCKNGVMVIHTLEDPAKVDEVRRSVGLTQPLAEYSAQLGIGRPC